MKTKFTAFVALFCVWYTASFGQFNPTFVRVNGVNYSNNQTIYVGCVTLMNVSIYAWSTYENRYVNTDIVTTPGSYIIPNNWNVNFLPAGSGAKTSASLTTSTQGPGGLVSFAYTYNNELNDIATVNVYTTPLATFSSITPLPNPYSSATYTIQAATSGNTNWTGYGGIKINGSSYYSSLDQSATISTQAYGGRLEVTATNACGTGPVTSVVVGTPYIDAVRINGQNSSSGMATVSYVASLYLDTRNTATGANWVVTNGTGSISPSGLSCNAYPNNFLRVIGTATNASGSGQDATFYIFKEGSSPYRMAYPNPAKDQVTLEFEDALMAQELLTAVSLLDEKGKVWTSFDAKSAKNKSYFKENKAFKLDVNGLPRGTYYMHVQLADKVRKERIVLE